MPAARSMSSSPYSSKKAMAKKKDDIVAEGMGVREEGKELDAAAFDEADAVVRGRIATTTIADVVRSHFDARQREVGHATPASAAACALRRDLLSFRADVGADASDGGDPLVVAGEVANAIVSCLDSAMSTILRSSPSTKGRTNNNRQRGGEREGCYDEAITSFWEMATAFACQHDDGGGAVPLAVIDRASGYASLSEYDVGRVEACRLLGMMIRGILSSSSPSSSSDYSASASILKKGGGKKTRTKGVGVGVGATSSKAAAPWEVKSLLLATKALSHRVTDKIARVRNAAIVACGPLLTLLAPMSSSSSSPNYLARRKFLGESPTSSSSSSTTTTTTAVVGGLVESIDSLVTTILWLSRNDPSAVNRAAVIGVLPPLASATVVLTGKEGEDDGVGGSASVAVMHTVIERIRDVDVKVREAAIDSLRTNVNDYETELSGDMRVDILRTGLTKRCPATYAKTVELLCTSWLKSTKFDPILLLENLNPVINEKVCEEVARVLLRVASTIDIDGSVDRGVELVRMHFGGPELRSLVQMVLKRRGIVDIDESAVELSPAMALFLRVKCEMSSSPETVTDIIADVPTLCGLLNSHIDELIAFHNDDGAYDMMEDDEAAAFEDGRNFVCLQLMHMARSSELHREEGSRRHFVSIMRRILARLATPDDLVEACVKAMASAHDKESQFLQTISEILADVEDDDTFQSRGMDPRAIVIVRQMRIIAILSIVLESVSGNVTSHPILDTFFQHLSPAITSKNAVVREYGVICLSKFCLLSGEDKVMGEFRPLLFTIAGSVEERVEVRAQAALALCDLALIHEGILLETVSSDTMPSFKDMILGMLGHSKPGIVIIAAEIAAKLLLAGRLNDPTLIAWLILVYFDSSLTRTVGTDLEYDDIDDGGAEEASKKVGSPVRLQQLLSIFFPTYSMSSLDANDDMMASVRPLLSIVNRKLSGLKQVDVKATTFPVAKMIEYICYNVDLADKKKSDEAKNDLLGTKNTGEEATVNNDCGEQTMKNTKMCVPVEKSKTASHVEVDEEVVIEASSILLASIDIAEFLSEECDSAPTFFIRSLAKILASARIDVNAEDKELLRRLKSCVGEAEYANDDGPTVKSIKKLADLLVDVDDEDASSDDETAPFEEVEETESRSYVSVESEVKGESSGGIEKENSRLSVGSSKTANQRRTSSSSLRVRLADVNN